MDNYESNKIKAYALIFENCNKAMQTRIEECTDFETYIRDNPRVLLNEIKRKMYDPARSKYEYAFLTESLRRIFDTKQEEDEGLVEYTKRYKQERDIVIDSIGTELLHNFVETTAEYQAETDNDIKIQLKEESFNKWKTYIYLHNSDQKKYGTLMKTFKTQY